MRAKPGRPQKRIEIGTHLVMDHEIYHGELTFKGTRVPVDVVLTYVIKGMPLKEVPENWPDVSIAAVREALALGVNASM